MNKVSLVMATLGRVREIEVFLQSLAAQSYQAYELIIVDQNPDNRLIPVIRLAEELEIPLIHLRQEQPNLCMARNTGLNQAQGEIVAFPDDDCWYETDVLEKVLVRFNAPDAPEGIIIRWIEPDPNPCAPRILTNKLWRRFQEVQASSISLFFNRQLLIEMQGFDANFGLHSWYGAGEETDLMFRIMSKGSRIAYLPSAIVHHPTPKMVKLPFDKSYTQTRNRSRGTGALYAKHGLSIWVIIRGLFSPWFHGLLNMFNPTVAGAELGKAIGRLQGYCRWLIQKNILKS